MDSIMDARALAVYISNEYEMKFGKKISPVRLQKTLYFCFAYWGGFVRKGKQENSEIDVKDFSEYLFANKIEAWVYGPVIPDVYFADNIERYHDSELFKDNDILKTMIDNVLEDTYAINDFRLVDISHKDNSWIKNFHYDEQYHNNEIQKEEIIEEYARK